MKNTARHKIKLNTTPRHIEELFLNIREHEDISVVISGKVLLYLRWRRMKQFMSLYQTSSIGETARQRSSGCSYAPGIASGVRSIPTALIQLTKPKIMLLVLVTGATALVLEGSFLTRPFDFMIFLLGLYLTGGAANAFNQYFEHDIDSRMGRTRLRRPLPRGQLSLRTAFWFATALGASGVILLGLAFNVLTAALALATLLFYSLFYTRWLKRNTPQNIVVGGIAGAMAPVGAWAAATGTTAVTPWILFLVVLFWTPPHFWSLALRFKDDYDKAGLPMMPQVKGVEGTLRLIFLYALALTAASLSYGFYGGGWLYLAAAVVLNLIFLGKTRSAWKAKSDKKAWSVFTYSILYLFGLFLAMVVDKLIR